MRLEALDLNLLVCLGHLLEQQSVSKAAARMAVSQPTMSHRLSQLRDLFDDDLLVRQGRAMVLTPVARELRPQVDAALTAARNLLASQARFDPATDSGDVRILASDYEWSTVLLPLTDALAKAAPGLGLVRMPPTPDAASRMADGGVDFCILPRMANLTSVPPELQEAIQALEIEALFQDEWVAVLREGHPAADALTLNRLADLDHVMVSFQGTTALTELDRLLDAHGLRRRVAARVPGFHMIWRTVCATDMIGMLPRRFAETLPGMACLPHPAALAPIGVGLWWHPRIQSNRRLAWFRKFVLEWFSEDPPAAKAHD